jgi:hypothetical protein
VTRICTVSSTSFLIGVASGKVTPNLYRLITERIINAKISIPMITIEKLIK